MGERRSLRNKRKRHGAEQIHQVEDHDEVASLDGGVGGMDDDDATGTFASLPEEQQNKLIARVMRVLILKNGTKIPVRREDLSKALGNEHGRPAKLFPEAFRLARNHFRQVFGFDIKEVRRTVAVRGAVSQPSRRTNTQASSATPGAAPTSGGKHYILVNTLSPKLRPVLEDSAIHGFIAAVAAMIILVPDGKLVEEELWRNLEKMGAHTTDAEHPQLGNVKNLMEKLVKQWYFEKERIDDTAKFIIGPRFRAEVADEDLLKIVETIYTARLEDSSRNDLLLRLRGVQHLEEQE